MIYQDSELKKIDSLEQKTDNLTRRQDNGFDFMKYFMGNSPQAQAQQNQIQPQQNQVQPRQYQQPLSLQQQHQLQQQQLTQQQQQRQQQLQQLQQQQLLQQLQQLQAARSNEVLQDNTAHQQQQQTVNREGGYGTIGIGGYNQQPKQIGISIGGGAKPGNVVSVGNILTLLPRIMNVLSAGGKVMFGVELGNNFYFGPVGAKPLYKG